MSRYSDALAALRAAQRDVDELENMLDERRALALSELIEEWETELRRAEMDELRYRGTTLGREAEIRADVLRDVIGDASVFFKPAPHEQRRSA